jgi:recombination protein RecR
VNYPPAIKKLINLLGYLPSVGPKTAERYALFLLKQSPEFLTELTAVVAELQASVVYCSECFCLSASDPCPICADAGRYHNVICVVAETKDMLAIESSQAYSGVYHVLGGTLSAINNRGPQHLQINPLLAKANSGQIQEIVLALNPDLEGESTCIYLKNLLANSGVKISRLARGLPSGASLDYADEQTIAHALKFRNKIN